MTKARPLSAILADENIICGTTPMSDARNSDANMAEERLSRAHKEPRHYLLIGSGRVARHLQFYFSTLSNETSKFTLQTWDRNQDPQALNLKLNQATHVLLAIKDSALQSFYDHYLQGQDLVCVHFSAATFVEGTYSAHPLMTFSDTTYDSTFYNQIHFIVRSNAGFVSKLQDVIPDFPNSSAVIQPDQSAKYHALCVMAGNFPQILWSKVARDFKAMNIPAGALDLYLRQVLENFLTHPESALTGPLIREDQKTIQANLESLTHDEFQIVYKSFVQAYSSFKNSSLNKAASANETTVTSVTSAQGKYRDEANSI